MTAALPAGLRAALLEALLPDILLVSGATTRIAAVRDKVMAQAPGTFLL
jgi:hypothetical protein